MALAAVALLCLCGQYGLREDEIYCEAAANHLAECCPGFDLQGISCEFASGCDQDHYPNIPVSTAKCVVAKSCDELQSSGLCDDERWRKCYE